MERSIRGRAFSTRGGAFVSCSAGRSVARCGLIDYAPKPKGPARGGPTRRGEITSKRSPLRSSRGDPQGDGGPAVVRSAARCGRCSRWRRPPLSRPGWSAREWRRARRRRGRPPRRRRTSGDWPGRSGDTQSGEGAGAGRNYCGWSGCGGAARRSSSARRFPSLRDLRGAASRFSSSVTDCRRAQLAARFLW